MRNEELGIFVRGERRGNAVTELVEVPCIDYAEPMPKIMRT